VRGVPVTPAGEARRRLVARRREEDAEKGAAAGAAGERTAAGAATGGVAAWAIGRGVARVAAREPVAVAAAEGERAAAATGREGVRAAAATGRRGEGSGRRRWSRRDCASQLRRADRRKALAQPPLAAAAAAAAAVLHALGAPIDCRLKVPPTRAPLGSSSCPHPRCGAQSCGGGLARQRARGRATLARPRPTSPARSVCAGVGAVGAWAGGRREGRELGRGAFAACGGSCACGETHSRG